MANRKCGNLFNKKVLDFDQPQFECDVCPKVFHSQCGLYKHLGLIHNRRYHRGKPSTEIPSEEIKRVQARLRKAQLNCSQRTGRRQEHQRRIVRIPQDTTGIQRKLHEGREWDSVVDAREGTHSYMMQSATTIMAASSTAESSWDGDTEQIEEKNDGGVERDMEAEHLLREAAANGDERKLWELLGSAGAKSECFVNARHAINGWTALHWACKRGQTDMVKILLSVGADPATKTNNGETCLQLAAKDEIRVLLGGPSSSLEPSVKKEPPSAEKPQFIPNYLAHPTFPYYSQSSKLSNSEITTRKLTNKPTVHVPALEGVVAVPEMNNYSNELVLKVRLAYREPYYIEVDVPCSQIRTLTGVDTTCSLTYNRLIERLCSEFEIDRSQGLKLVKLPDTLVRNDRDVQRLKHLQELEIIW